MKGKVNPIKNLADIERVRKILEEKPRDLLLFDIATQTGLEIKQILNIRVRHFLGCKVGARLVLPQPEGKPLCVITVSRTLHQSWENYRRKTAPNPDDYLIQSQKNSRPPTLSSVSHMINKWFKAANLEGVKGAKSLKRTWQVFFKPEKADGIAIEKISKSMPLHDPQHTRNPSGHIKTLQETVHENLFQAIIFGRIPPGERLVIDKIARQMEVSRIPVREAFHRLQETGLISIDNWKGAVVNRLSGEDLREITIIRLMLECEAAERAAQNYRNEVLDQLENIHKKWKQSISLLDRYALETVENYLQLNRQFHNLIYHEAQMPILYQIINGLWNRVSAYLHILVAGGVEGSVSGETIKIHRGMLDGMKERSPRVVSHWLREDLIRAEKSILHFLNLDDEAKSRQFLASNGDKLGETNKK